MRKPQLGALHAYDMRRWSVIGPDRQSVAASVHVTRRNKAWVMDRGPRFGRGRIGSTRLLMDRFSRKAGGWSAGPTMSP